MTSTRSLAFSDGIGEMMKRIGIGEIFFYNSAGVFTFFVQSKCWNKYKTQGQMKGRVRRLQYHFWLLKL